MHGLARKFQLLYGIAARSLVRMHARAGQDIQLLHGIAARSLVGMYARRHASSILIHPQSRYAVNEPCAPVSPMWTVQLFLALGCS